MLKHFIPVLLVLPMLLAGSHCQAQLFTTVEKFGSLHLLDRNWVGASTTPSVAAVDNNRRLFTSVNGIIYMRDGTSDYYLAGGSGAGLLEGTGKEVRFGPIRDLIISPAGHLIIAEATCLKQYNMNTKLVTMVAGSASASGHVDGNSSTARFSDIKSLAYMQNVLYIVDGPRTIRTLDRQNVGTLTFPNPAGFTDGNLPDASFTNITCISRGGQNKLLIGDNYCIRQYNPSSNNISTLIGDGATMGFVNHPTNPRLSRLGLIRGIANLGNEKVIYFTDQRGGNLRVTHMNIGRTVDVIAPTPQYEQDGIIGTGAASYYIRRIVTGGSDVLTMGESSIRRYRQSDSSITSYYFDKRAFAERNLGEVARDFNPEKSSEITKSGFYYTAGQHTISLYGTGIVAGQPGRQGSQDGFSNTSSFTNIKSIAETKNGHLLIVDGNAIRFMNTSTYLVETLLNNPGNTGGDIYTAGITDPMQIVQLQDDHFMILTQAHDYILFRFEDCCHLSTLNTFTYLNVAPYIPFGHPGSYVRMAVAGSRLWLRGTADIAALDVSSLVQGAAALMYSGGSPFVSFDSDYTVVNNQYLIGIDASSAFVYDLHNGSRVTVGTSFHNILPDFGTGLSEYTTTPRYNSFHYDPTSGLMYAYDYASGVIFKGIFNIQPSVSPRVFRFQNNHPTFRNGSASINYLFNTGAPGSGDSVIVLSGQTMDYDLNLTNVGFRVESGGTINILNGSSMATCRFWGPGSINFNGQTLGGDALGRDIKLRGTFNFGTTLPSTSTNTGSVIVQGKAQFNGLLALSNLWVFDDTDVNNRMALIPTGGSSFASIIGNLVILLGVHNPLFNGSAYRMFGSPINNITINNLGSISAVPFTAVTNTAFNTSPTPASVLPYPTVFGYQETRITDPGNDVFGQGWESPGQIDPMVAGRGYSLHMAFGAKLALKGGLWGNTVSRAVSRGSQTESGWNLLSNPFPAVLDWDAVVADPDFTTSNLANAIWVSEATGPYTGVYRSYINGIGANGGTRYLSPGQGFFTRLPNANTAGTITMKHTHVAGASANGMDVRREAAEDRTIIRLKAQSLTGANLENSITETVMYFQQGAGLQALPKYDAAVAGFNSGMPTLWTQMGTAALGINGLPDSLLLTGYRIPVGLRTNAAGEARLWLDTIQNLPAGTTVMLEDQTTGQQYAAGQNLTLNLGRSTVVNNRFALVIRSAGPTALSSGIVSNNLRLWPNPATSSVQVEASVTNKATSVEVLTISGKVVFSTPMPSNIAHLNLSHLSRGLYVVRMGSETSRLVLQ